MTEDRKLKEAREKLERLTPERNRIARLFKDNIENAIYQLGPEYTVDLQGDFEATPIRITIEIRLPSD